MTVILGSSIFGAGRGQARPAIASTAKRAPPDAKTRASFVRQKYTVNDPVVCPKAGIHRAVP